MNNIPIPISCHIRVSRHLQVQVQKHHPSLSFICNKVKLFTITSTNTMSLRSSMQASRRVFQTAASTHRSIVSSVCRRSFSAGNEPAISDLSASYIALEEKYGAHNYHPLPVVLTKGEGMCRCCLIRFQFSFARVHIM